MRIESNQSLRGLNTFGIDAAAKHFATVRSAEDFQALRHEPVYSREPRLILGGGSNLLFRTDFDGLVIKVAFDGIAVLRDDPEHVWVRAGAGVVWHDFVLHCVRNGWAGVENLALIPGLVGAAPMQNIGAYGVEMESVCDTVEALDVDSGEAVTFAHAGCEFGYRDSIFKRQARGQFLIHAVTFRLSRTPQFVTHYGDVARTLEEMGVVEPTLETVTQAIIRIRSAKLPDPAVLGNAGSFFKNPVIPAVQFERLAGQYTGMPHYPQPDGAEKIPAGWLIEQCGWKGCTRGRAGVHDRQALVLVNRGGATGAEIYQLALEISASVHARFGIDLVPEVNLV